MTIQINNLSVWDGMKYAEEGQINPIRWNVLKNIGKDTYEPVTYKFMCKDFLNEVVMSYHTGNTYSIYGFSASPKMFNKEWKGLPIRLSGLYESFYSNINIINKYLKEQGFPELNPEKVDQTSQDCVINIPEEYLENTFYMSQVSLFMRMANNEKPLSSFDELGESLKGDKNYAYYAASKKKPISKLHPSLKKYIFYWNNSNNFAKGDTKSVLTSYIHNCGVVNWGWK